MRALRGLLLLAILVAVYFAQFIFDQGSLQDFFPNWLLGLFPSLLRFTRWLPQDLFVLAAWITAISAITFGLLVPLWRGRS